MPSAVSGLGETVAILGPGAQGLATVIAAREAGATVVIDGRPLLEQAVV